MSADIIYAQQLRQRIDELERENARLREGMAGLRDALEQAAMDMEAFRLAMGAADRALFAPCVERVTVRIIWDSDHDEKGDPAQYVTAIEVVGKAADGKTIDISYEDEPAMHVVDFWRWLAAQHGWALDDC